MEWQMYFSKNISGVNPVVMNYKIRYTKNQSAWGQLGIALHGQTAFPLLFVVAEKQKNSLDMQGYVQG